MKSRKLGIILSYVNTGLNMVIGLFMSAFLIRLLGDTEYGIYKTMSSFANCLVLFEFGTGTVMTRNLSVCFANNEPQEKVDRNISTIWVITNILAVFISIVSVIFYFAADNIYANSLTPEQIVYGKKIFIFVAVYLVASFYVQTLHGVVMAYEYYPFASLMNIIKIISRTALLVVLLCFIQKAIWIAVVDMAVNVGILIVTLIFCKIKCRMTTSFNKFDINIFKSSLPMSLAIFLQVIVNQANSNVDSLLIGIKLNPESVSLYSVGLYVYSIFSSLTTTPISMYAPQIVRTVHNGASKQALTDSLVQPSRLIVLVGGSILFGFIAAGRQFIEIVYGAEYLDAWIIAIVIMAPMFINMANGVMVNVLDAMNKRMARSKALIITTIANIILTFFWLDWWGPIGAALATCVCTILGQVLIMNIYYHRVIGVNVIYLFGKTFKGILLYQIIAAAISFLIAIRIENLCGSFAVAIGLYLLIFGIGYLRFGANDVEQQMIKRTLKVRR